MKASPRSLLGLVVLVLGISAGVQWWHGAQDARLGAAIAERAAPGDIRMIASDTCTYCAHARAWMGQYRVRFSECSIERDPACAAAFRDSQAPGTPVVVVRGQRQVGFDPRRVLAALS
ncbi:glutaredoxin family protein [Ideonella sp. BN130291]|uniref:glutaredoxin family protein n=1 Tax=Ideonella sp. BN130291 TaxID=3112940 RepID=UPI002E2542D9|nr:glutaredoxin domain-containing protein [Ideonella sp. BN130291]